MRTCCIDTKQARAFSEHTHRWGGVHLAGLEDRRASLKTEPSETGNGPLVAERAYTCKLRQATGERGQMSKGRERDTRVDRRAKEAKE